MPNLSTPHLFILSCLVFILLPYSQGFLQSYFLPVPLHPRNNNTDDNPFNKDPRDIQTPMDFLVYAFRDRTYTGHWVSQNNQLPFLNFFDGQRGFISIDVEKFSGAEPPSYLIQEQRRSLDFDSPAIPFAPSEVTWALVVKIYDGEYIDQKSVEIVYKMNSAPKLSFDSKNSNVNAEYDLMDVFLKQGTVEIVSSRTCISSFAMKFINEENGSPWHVNSSPNNGILALFEIESDICGFKITTDTLTTLGSASEDEVLKYVIFLSTIGMIKILGALKLGNNLNRKAQAFKISMGSLWAIATFDYYILVLNMLFVFAYSGIILVPTTIYMILSFYVERRVVLKCLQKRGRNQADETSDEFKSCGFYFIALALLFILELIFILSCRIWIIYISALIFVPQIFHNFRKGKNYNPNFYMLIPLGLTRLSIVLYVKYYPRNIFRLSPDLTFIITYFAIFIGQIFILLIQIKWPTFGLRHKNRRPSRMVYEDDLCSICMGHLMHPSCDIEGSLLQRRPTIETNCSHVFHKECLRKWISNKVECPICRTSIEDTVEDLESADENPVPPI